MKFRDVELEHRSKKKKLLVRIRRFMNHLIPGAQEVKFQKIGTRLNWMLCDGISASAEVNITLVFKSLSGVSGFPFCKTP